MSIGGFPLRSFTSTASNSARHATGSAEVRNHDEQEGASPGAPGHMAATGVPQRSLSERFQVEPHTGGASFTVPINTSPGRSGFGPTLHLQYSSGLASTNSVFGMGWSLSGVDSISRKTSNVIPTYDDDEDIFVHSTLGDLVPVMSADGQAFDEVNVDGYHVRRYQPRVKSAPVRIERWTKPTSIFWKSINAENITTVFGDQDGNQIFHCGDEKRIFSWLVAESYDSRGNHIAYTYKQEDSSGISQALYEVHRGGAGHLTQRYLKSIRYGNEMPTRDTNWKIMSPLPRDLVWLFEVIFDYGEHEQEKPTTQDQYEWNTRVDPFSVYKTGFEIRTYRLCHRVLMFHHFSEELGRQDCLVSSTSFQYNTDPYSGSTFLQSCTQHGHSPVGEDEYWTSSLPAFTFQYQKAPALNDLQTEEFNTRRSGFQGKAAQWVDLNGEGAPGVLAKVPGGGWYYQRNLTNDCETQIGDPQLVKTIPNMLDNQMWEFEDLEGNGLPDVVLEAPEGLHGFYGRESGGGWASFTSFESNPMVYDAGKSSIRRVDLTGDGHSDLLRMANDGNQELTWYKSLGTRGFGEARRTVGAPSLPLEDPNSAILLCDMSGDGLADIVCLGNGNICYWPNTGYGTFGAKVVMENAPVMAKPSEFSPVRIRTADLAGSGTTDLIYLLPEGGATIYYNQQGNCWSEGCPLPFIPALDHTSSVDVLDITGRGTHCLCWASDLHGNASNGGLGTIQYVDLTGGQRPGILYKCLNRIGGEITLSYRSSSMFYRDDERAGRPWTTRLPFPLQCISRVEVVDHIAQTSQVKRYVYHNGYYDPIDRQFQGFQMVETWDAEEYLTETLARFQRPPVLSRAWYYLGFEEADEVTALPWSYLVSHRQHIDIPSATIPSNITSRERHEAYRSLAGRPRRQEIFSSDKSDKRSLLPYTITQQTYEVVLEQRMDNRQRYAISRVNDREEVSATYERVAQNTEQQGASSWTVDPCQARMQHHFTLQTDSWGNKLLEATIKYGKLGSQLSRPEDRQRQTDDVMNYTKAEFTNAVENESYFHAPLIAGVRHYRVFPKPRSNGSGRYSWDELVYSDFHILTQAIEIPTHESLAEMLEHGHPLGYKTLLTAEQVLYTDDLRNPLEYAVLKPFSDVYQTYKLAFTSQLLDKAYAGIRPAINTHALQTQLQAGGYKELPSSSGQWWLPSSRALFGNDPRSEDWLATARSQFYIPSGQIDPLGGISRQSYDSHYLLMMSSTDALLNTTAYRQDYARLQPTLITDANNNQTEVALDPLGLQIGVATMGKSGDSVGDSFNSFSYELHDNDLDAFLANPSEMADRLLGTATSRTIHDFHRYGRAREISNQSDQFTPPFVAELTRHNHCDSTGNNRDQTQISIHITYMNGTSQTIQEATLTRRNEQKIRATWNITGWVLHDNKGEPVKQFQPFTTGSHHFQRQTDHPTLPATISMRDPLGRVVGVVNADHTWTKTRFTPWVESSFDAGDTVLIEDLTQDVDVGSYFQRLNLESHFSTWYQERIENSSDQFSEDDKKAARQSEVYHDTPLTAHLDALGQHILQETGHGMERRETRTEFNVRGNLEITSDSLDRTVEVKQYDLLGRPLHTCNMDQGQRWLLSDCHGAPLLSWSDRGIRQRMEYDKLQRPTNTWIQCGPTAPDVLTVKRVYGEEHPAADLFNLKGQLWQCYDQSGLRTNDRADFKGNCTDFSIRYGNEYRRLIDWSRPNHPADLEEKEYKSTITFNALGQPLDMVAHGVGSIRREYDVAGRLLALRSYGSNGGPVTSSADNIEYEPDGQIKCVTFGNGSRTTHTYDPRTRRVIETRTVRIKNNKVLQDLSYTYDCTGNIVRTEDHTQQAVFFQNTVVSSERRFWYDFLGQLVKATGREQVNVSNRGSKELQAYDFNAAKRNRTLGGDREIIRYEERYTYDKAGNILQLKHIPRASYSGWTRRYMYKGQSCIKSDERSNRLTSTEVGGKQQTYQYDNDAGRHGCMTKVPGYSSLGWDPTDNLQSFSMQRVSGPATPETTWYVYDASGTRVRKITERSISTDSGTTPIKSKETRYLPMFDLFTAYKGDGCSIRRQITTLNVGDTVLGTAPVAMLEQGHDSGVLVRYQVGSNLGLDNTAAPIFYEEYSPYGASTYQYRYKGVPRKYRFASYHRDQESGLYHCGARYYAPWLGRWISADPLGTVDGLNVYTYTANDPVNFDDHKGTIRNKKQNKQIPSGQNDGQSTSQDQRNRQGGQRGRGLSNNNSQSALSQSNARHDRRNGPGQRNNGQQNHRTAQNKGIPRPPPNAGPQGPRETVQLMLGGIRWSQDSVNDKVHRLINGKMTLVSIRDEVHDLRERYLMLLENQTAQNAVEGALQFFHSRFDPISVTGAWTKNLNNIEPHWFSTDNRRLTIMCAALPANTIITANRATDEELENMGSEPRPPNRELIETFRSWSKRIALGAPGDVRDTETRRRRSKWTTRNRGLSIVIRGQ